ncbi:MAG: glycosyltransferase family 39 protein [Cyanobacteria bacterium P01_E01_bin.35]
MSHQKLLPGFNLASVGLMIIVLLLGLFFRWANLGHKVFWVDEIATAVRVSGYTVAEVTDDLVNQDIFTRNILFSYQAISPDKTFEDSMIALTKSPEHAPLYFILTRLWMQLWGNSLTVMRSLSVCFSLLILPSLYWLGTELFNRPLVSWLAISLMSLSPFYVAYAQEARPYSLWTVTVLMTSAAFIRAIRCNRTKSWLLYSCCLIISLYTSLFSIYVAFSQGIYLLITVDKTRLSLIKNYIIFSGMALIAFAPWIQVITSHLDLLQENTSWMRGNFNLADIVAVFVGTNLLIFGDLPISQASNPIQVALVLIILVMAIFMGIKFYPQWKNKLLKYALLLSCVSGIFLLSNYIYLDWTTIIGALVAICILSLSGYSLFYLLVNSNRDRWLFIICLMLSLPVPLVLTDIINQGQGSTAPRYLIPLQLGILIAVAYTLASKLIVSKQQKFWQLIIVACFALGIFSNIRNYNLSPFYQKGRNVNNPAIAQIINQSSSALVIVEAAEAMDLVSLAYSLNEEVRYKVMTNKDDLALYTKSFDNTYLLKPSPNLIQKSLANKQINFQQVYKSHVFSADEFPLDLWQINSITNN